MCVFNKRVLYKRRAVPRMRYRERGRVIVFRGSVDNFKKKK